jgi:hypothetical protein
MTAQKLRAAVDRDGTIQAWHHRVACEDPLRRYDPPLYEGWGQIPLISMLGAEHQAHDRSPLLHAYNLPARLVEHIPVDTGIRVYAMRGVGAGPNKFAIESFIDEIAARLQVDPLAYRLQLLQQSPRAQQVLRKAAELARWGEPRPGRAPLSRRARLPTPSRQPHRKTPAPDAVPAAAGQQGFGRISHLSRQENHYDRRITGLANSTVTTR